MGDSERQPKILLAVTSERPVGIDPTVAEQHITEFFTKRVKPIVASNTKVMLHWDGIHLESLFVRSVIPNECSLVPNHCIFDPSNINVKNVLLPTILKPTPPTADPSTSSTTINEDNLHEIIENEEKLSFNEGSTSAQITIKKRTKRYKKVPKPKALPRLLPAPMPSTSQTMPVNSVQSPVSSIQSPYAGMTPVMPRYTQQVFIQPIAYSPMPTTVITPLVTLPKDTYRPSHNYNARRYYDRHVRRSSEESTLQSEAAYELLEKAKRAFYRRKYMDQPEEEEPPQPRGSESDSS